MNQETGYKNYRILSSYFEKKIPIHFRLYSGGWKNGLLIDLSMLKSTLVLKEFIEGELPILLEDIIPESIKPFKKKDGGK